MFTHAVTYKRAYIYTHTYTEVPIHIVVSAHGDPLAPAYTVTVTVCISRQVLPNRRPLDPEPSARAQPSRRHVDRAHAADALGAQPRGARDLRPQPAAHVHTHLPDTE